MRITREETSADASETDGYGKGSGVRGQAPRRESPAPAVPTIRFIPEDSNPNRLLEIYSPRKALALVTKDHRRMSDWIRSQPWDHRNPTRDQWRFIGASKRLKACRNQLRDFVEDLDSITAHEVHTLTGLEAVTVSAADEVVRLPREMSDADLAAEAQREADLFFNE